jgi:GAF domain-containing protein
MSALWDVLDLLSSPPGALVYYLILLFCIWAVVGLALSRWSRGERGGLVARLLFAGALMSFSRFFPILIALLSRQGGFSLVRFLPPLERFVDALSALLFCWAFVFPHRFKVASRAILGISVLLTLALYAFSATSWMNILDASPLATYNGTTMQSWIWEVWQLLFLIPAFVYTLVNPASERDALNIGLGVLVAGHLLQLAYPLSDRIEHLAAWARFANLIAFPLFGVATYQLVIQRFDAQVADLTSVNHESLAQIAGLISVLDTNLKVFASLDWDTVLQDSVQAFSQVLQSELCALILAAPQSSSGPFQNAEPVTRGNTSPEILGSTVALNLPLFAQELELAVLYDAPRFIRGDRRSSECRRIRVGEYPAVQRALAQSTPVVLGTATPDLGDRKQTIQGLDPLYRLLDCGLDEASGQVGSLLIQPLEHDSAAIGVLVACRSQNQGPFKASDARKSERLAAYLSIAIENSRRYQEVQKNIEQLHDEIDAMETRHTRLRTDLENRLARAEEQAALYMQRLYEAELGEQQAQEDAQDARRKLAALRQESQDEISRARDELRRSIQQVAHLTQQLASLDARCLQLGNLVHALEQEKGLLQLRLAVAAPEQDDSGG